MNNTWFKDKFSWDKEILDFIVLLQFSIEFWVEFESIVAFSSIPVVDVMSCSQN